MPKPRWVWEPFSSDTTSLSGDIGKLFRNDPVKTPGVLERDAPSPNAAVMAREVIQNSWDAAGEAQEADEATPDFQIEFSFLSASGNDKSKLVAALALTDLTDRLRECEAAPEPVNLGLRERTCLNGVHDDAEPLTYLMITESGTTGMYGTWSNGQSRMYLALATLGYTPKPGGGGSYGYGKAGMIRGSATHTIVAYSCFREGSAESGVTRRLLGMTYWGQHALNGKSYPGFARLGRRKGRAVSPFENEEADAVAHSLGMSIRDPSTGQDFGTTFLVVEPTVEPDDLQRAIERYWWPPLEDSSIRFGVSIRTESEVRHPRPKRDPVLRSFVDAYEAATVPQDNPHPHKQRGVLGKIGRFSAAGVLGLVAAPDDWSYPQQTEVDPSVPVDHRSLVAIMRNPRMVVEYYEAGQAPPFVRGAFIADPGVDGTLRKTEPKGHDAWQTKPDDEGGDAEAAKIAELVLKRIKDHVGKFRRELKPPKARREGLRLREFERLVSKLLSGEGPHHPPLPSDPRDVSINLDPRVEETGSDSIRVRGNVRFGLTDEFDGDIATVAVRLRYVFVEDDRVGDAVSLEIDPPWGFALNGAPELYTGQIHRGSPVQFSFASESHDALWTGRVIAEANVVKEGGA